MDVRKFLLRFIIGLFLSIYMWVNFFVFPVHAGFSSLDSCSAQPNCAAAFVTNSQIRSQILSTQTVPLNNIVQFSRVSNGVVTSSGSVAFTKFSNPIISAGAGYVGGNKIKDLLVDFFTEEDIDSLRDDAIQKFCEQYPENPNCNVRDVVYSRGGWTVKDLYLNFDIISYNDEELVLERLNTSTPESGLIVPLAKPYNNFEIHKQVNSYGSRKWDTLVIVYGVSDDGYDWNEWDTDSRNTAVSLLTDEEIIQKVDSEPMTNSFEELEDDEDLYVEIPHISDDLDIASTSVFQNENSSTSNNPDNNGTSNENDTETGGSTSTETGTTGNGGNTSVENPDGEQSPGEPDDTEDTIPPPDTGEEVDGEPEQEPELEEETASENPVEVPTIEQIEPKTFDAPNFLEYGVSVFSDKFPFDIFGDLSNEEFQNECPSYSFFGNSYELCPIKDFLEILKIPVIIGFLIRTYHSL